MKKRFKIPIIITIISLVISCFTIPAFATASPLNPTEIVYEPILYPRYSQYQYYNSDDSSIANYATFDTSVYLNINNVLWASTSNVELANNNTAVLSSVNSVLTSDDLSAYINYSYTQGSSLQLSLMNITYYFDDIGVRGDLNDQIIYQDYYQFVAAYENQDKENLLQGYTVYFTYKSYDYLADDFKTTIYQQSFTRISNESTAILSTIYGVDSSMLYFNPLELCQELIENDDLSSFGVLTDIRVEVSLYDDLIPSLYSMAVLNYKDFNAEHTTSVRDDLYTQYGEDNSASAEVPTDVFGWVVDCASSLFEFELMPGLSISIVFVGILGILVFIYIMKRFAGG